LLKGTEGTLLKDLKIGYGSVIRNGARLDLWEHLQGRT